MPIHVEDLTLWPNIFRRIAVTIEAPFHEQRAMLPHERHVLHGAVATRAANALVHVNRMIEIDVIGEAMHAVPFDRLAATKALADRTEQFGADPNLLVAVHARLSRGHAGVGRCLDGAVTIAAIDAETGDVMLMTEWNGLITDDADISHVGRADERRPGDPRAGDNENRSEDRDLRDRVETAMENLRQIKRPSITRGL